MKAVEEDLRALSRAVLHEARAEAEQILADATTKADVTRRRAQEQADKERQEILARARQEAEHIRREAIATAQMQARTVQLERREKLLNDVFEQARQRLPSVQQWTDYGEIARRLTREAITRLDADAVLLRADAQARELLSDEVLASLAQELGVQVQWGVTLEREAGVIAETPDGHRRYYNTLQARLDRQQEALRSPVYRLLVGESV
jgi:vacuolar-type H+-ATPase subunit E/Vma4